MGTNYYATVDVCNSCGRSDTLHIGKSSAGWKFSFAAYENPPIWSWSEWERFLETKNALIEDEYGRSVPLENLRNLVEKKFRDGECASCGEWARSDDYHDPEGHPFSLGEFS